GQRLGPGTGRWARRPPMQAAFSGLGAAVVGGQLIPVGGDNGPTVFNPVRAYNLATKAWSTLPSLPAARTGLGVVAYRNILYALDGAAKPGHIATTSTVQILTVPSPPVHAAGGWRLGHNSLFPVQYAAAPALNY